MHWTFTWPAAIALPILIAVPATAAETEAKPKDTQPQEHLFGDWGGLRTELHDAGLDLAFGYIGQLAGNVSGGKDSGWDYAQQLELKLDADWDKIAGLTGFSTHTIFTNRLGRNVSKDYGGDNIFQAQSIYGGGGNVVIHLAEFYAEEKFANGFIDIAAGRLLVGEDYATSTLYCEFMSTAVCGYPNALAQKAGFSVYPNSTWGGRIRVSPGDYYVQAGIYQVRPQGGDARDLTGDGIVQPAPITFWKGATNRFSRAVWKVTTRSALRTTRRTIPICIRT